MNWKEIERFASFPPMEAIVEYRISQDEAKEILSLRSAKEAAEEELKEAKYHVGAKQGAIELFRKKVNELKSAKEAAEGENARLRSEGVEVAHDLRAKLDVAEAKLCRAKEIQEQIVTAKSDCFHDRCETTADKKAWGELCKPCEIKVEDLRNELYNFLALSSTAPCPHEAEAKRLREAMEWALGEGKSDFQPRGENDPPYWWRKELRRRAAMKEG